MRADGGLIIPEGVSAPGFGLVSLLGRRAVEQLIESLIEELDAADGDPDVELDGDELEDSECLEHHINEVGTPIGQLAGNVASEDDEPNGDDEDPDFSADSPGPLRIVQGKVIDIWVR